MARRVSVQTYNKALPALPNALLDTSFQEANDFVDGVALAGGGFYFVMLLLISTWLWRIAADKFMPSDAFNQKIQEFAEEPVIIVSERSNQTGFKQKKSILSTCFRAPLPRRRRRCAVWNSERSDNDNVDKKHGRHAGRRWRVLSLGARQEYWRNGCGTFARCQEENTRSRFGWLFFFVLNRCATFSFTERRLVGETGGTCDRSRQCW